MPDEARWPPSPCERVINEDGDICADTATYRPGLYAYLCEHHAEEGRLRKQLREYGYDLRPLWSGYGVWQDDELLTFCSDLAAVEALLLTDKEVQDAASRIAKDFPMLKGETP